MFRMLYMAVGFLIFGAIVSIVNQGRIPAGLLLIGLALLDVGIAEWQYQSEKGGEENDS